ncbi:putative immunity protein [Streptomyces longwoodensis]|uniref:putative immunity protein n=1 Tax=Streptomyces longwoodensis TaxID=68231 RepID=UPI00340BC99F
MTEDASEIVAFAAACAETALDVFEADRPDDPRPREAVGAAWEFALGGERGKALRHTALAALKAAAAAGTVAAREAALAAMSAAGSAYLHPLGQEHPGQAHPRSWRVRAQGGRARLWR